MLKEEENNMGMVVLSVFCSLAAYIVGSAIEIMPGINLPGFGIALSGITMGGFLMFQLRKK